MRYLLDTGVLLRVVNRDDPLHDGIRRAVRSITSHGDEPVTSLQNMAEFWNVCTRPAASRGGLGLTHEQTVRRLRLAERIALVLPEPADVFALWRGFVISHRVQGVQVHDARLAAFMTLHGITHIVTLNRPDFTRYANLVVLSPDQVPKQ